MPSGVRARRTRPQRSSPDSSAEPPRGAPGVAAVGRHRVRVDLVGRTAGGHPNLSPSQKFQAAWTAAASRSACRLPTWKA
jgi:hypothetical protein